MVKRGKKTKKKIKKRTKKVSKTKSPKKKVDKKKTQKRKMKVDQGAVICQIHSECQKLCNLLGAMVDSQSNNNGGE
jgi:hypothetical protein